MLGDWWDFPSLSSYDLGTIRIEGKRLANDILAGNDAMKRFLAPLEFHNKVRAHARRSRYKPDMHFLLGNHENRLMRYVADNPHLEILLSYESLALSDWKVHDFLRPVFIDGLAYAHYFANPLSGRPYGGGIANVLNKLGYSFVMGHTQKLDFARKDLTNGKVIQGLIAGSFYLHEEEYKGYQGNHHWRGVCMLHNVADGNYDLEVISIDRLLKEFGGKIA